MKFRSLLRQSSQFSNYNFREYARRKTRDSFREHQKESEERRIQELIQEGLQSLRLLKVSPQSQYDVRDVVTIRNGLGSLRDLSILKIHLNPTVWSQKHANIH